MRHDRRLHLTVIAKEPLPGMVKTRLCPPLTSEQAAELAAAALEDTFAAVAALAASRPSIRTVALVDGAPGPWIPHGFDVSRQRGAGLAARLGNGFADLGAGVVIGMDTPGGLAHIGRLLDAVAAGYDAIGLAADGGYWAIGLADPDPAVFAGVPMSRAHTGLAQLRRLHALGRRVRLAPMVHDLDRFEDLPHVAAEAGNGRLAAAITRLGILPPDRMRDRPTSAH